MADLSHEERLRRLAKALNANRVPFYQRHPLPVSLRAVFPTEGWYWIPPGAHELQLLARDAFDAYHLLMTMLEQQLENPEDDQ